MACRVIRRAAGPSARLAAALLCAGLALPAAAAARSVLFVGNSEDGTVTLVDTHHLGVIGHINAIPDGNTPRDPAQAAIYPLIVAAKGVNYVQGIAVSPNGRTLYVSRGYLGDVAAFRISDGHELWRLQINGIRADHVALTPDGRRLFVSALTANEVQVIDTRTHSFVGSFPTGDWPHVLEFGPHGYIWNGSLGNQLEPSGHDGRKQLTMADPNTLQVKRTLQFDAGVRPFVFTRDGRLAYVQLSYLNGFIVVDPLTGRTLHAVHLPVSGPGKEMSPSQYPNQAAHHGIALSPGDRTICDAGTISNYVALVARGTLRTRALIPVGDQPAEAETSADGRYCLVTDRGPGSNSLSVISYRKRREVRRLRMGKHPQEEQEAVVPDSVLRGY